jgi:uncharacterized protein YdeI (BOF family)
MKSILILCAATLVVASVFVWRAVAKPSRFGSFTGAPRAEVAALVDRPKDFLGKTVSVEGTITEQCKAMGCFFNFRDGNKALRVDLEDIAMTAPMHEGKPAVVEGQLVSRGDAYQLYASAVEFKK